MNYRKPSKPCFSWLAAILSILVAQGCASDSRLITDQMDPVTSVTISYSQTPLVFYRDVSGRAAYARDFVHMAPLEVNRSGDYRYYLWLGIWNTMADAQSERSRDGFETIVGLAPEVVGVICSDGEVVPVHAKHHGVAAIHLQTFARCIRNDTNHVSRLRMGRRYNNKYAQRDQRQ